LSNLKVTNNRNKKVCVVVPFYNEKETIANIISESLKYVQFVFAVNDGSDDGFSINAKSIIGVMTLAAEQGCELVLKIEGLDEDNAANELAEFFESGFGEQ